MYAAAGPPRKPQEAMAWQSGRDFALLLLIPVLPLPGGVSVGPFPSVLEPSQLPRTITI